jgi:hypothetical protein
MNLLLDIRLHLIQTEVVQLSLLRLRQIFALILLIIGIRKAMEVEQITILGEVIMLIKM